VAIGAWDGWLVGIPDTKKRSVREKTEVNDQGNDTCCNFCPPFYSKKTIIDLEHDQWVISGESALDAASSESARFIC